MLSYEKKQKLNPKYNKKRYFLGFTIIELLVVVAIIGLLATIALISLRRAVDLSRASKIMLDLRAIENAWALWQSDTGANFQHECRYKPPYSPPPPAEFGCSGQAALANSDLFSNLSGKPNWKGPYLAAIPQSPFKVPGQSYNRPYSYDFDGDLALPTGAAGVNIILVSCSVAETQDYLRIIDIMDKNFDNSDGANVGRMRWATAPNLSVGSFTYNIDRGQSISCSTPN